MNRKHFRALAGTFVFFAVTLVALVTFDALPGDAEQDPTHGAGASPASLETVPPVDAERVLSQVIQIRKLAQAVEAHEEAGRAAAQAQAEAEALQAFADAMESAQAAQAAQAAEAAKAAEAPAPVETSSSSGNGIPDDSYWDRMAMCETGGNWSMTGSRYSGGVGFYNGTWDAWGGREFADLAGNATREQQIIVANRVATQGYDGPRGFVEPVGYSGWGCVKSVGYP